MNTQMNIYVVEEAFSRPQTIGQVSKKLGAGIPDIRSIVQELKRARKIFGLKVDIEQETGEMVWQYTSNPKLAIRDYWLMVTPFLARLPISDQDFVGDCIRAYCYNTEGDIRPSDNPNGWDIWANLIRPLIDGRGEL